MKAWLRFNSLSVTVLSIFLVLLIGQCLTGWQSHNEERRRASAPDLSLTQYLSSGHFGEATSENWESEFLQMAAYVLLTVFLRQRGSAESKPFSDDEPVDRDPRLDRTKPDVPFPVRRGGLLLKAYEYSLTLAFFVLFLMAFAWHAVGGLRLENDERTLDGLPPISFSEFLSSSEFWFQSLQNWQSEFLAVGAIVLLSIWLRQRGSPESKPVSAPHGQTGE
jgi:Domain of unknown function (DUF6766)